MSFTKKGEKSNENGAHSRAVKYFLIAAALSIPLFFQDIFIYKYIEHSNRLVNWALLIIGIAALSFTFMSIAQVMTKDLSNYKQNRPDT